MLNKSIKTALRLLLIVLVGLMINIPTAAQSDPDANNFAMSPIEYSANQQAGDSFSVSFTLYNNTSSDININLLNAEMQFPDNQPTLTVNNLTTKDWVSFGQSFYILPANSNLNISATVSIPLDTKSGSYFPAILVSRVSQVPEDNSGSAEAAINTALAFRINLNVLAANEEVTSSAKASNLQVTNPVVINNVDIDYAITNPSNYYVKPVAYLQIVNPKQEVVWRSVINDNGNMVYPGSVLAASTSLQLPLFNLTDGGQYTAEFLVVDSQFGTTDIIKTNFTVIPFTLIIVVAAGVLVLLTALIISRKRRHRH